MITMSFDEMNYIVREINDAELADDLNHLTVDCFPVVDELIAAWVAGGYQMRGGTPINVRIA